MNNPIVHMNWSLFTLVMHCSWVVCDGAGWQKDPGESNKEAGDCGAQGE